MVVLVGISVLVLIVLRLAGVIDSLHWTWWLVLIGPVVAIGISFVLAKGQVDNGTKWSE